MRLLFLFLLLVNGFIYLWYSFYQQPVNAAPASIDTSAPRLVLLSELPPTVEDTTVAVTEPAETSGEVEDSEPQKVCYTLGPFMNEKSVSQATQELMLSGRPFEKRASEKKEQIGYWVFFPQFRNRAAALEKAEELRLLGDKHFYVVKESAEYANAISLGVFSGRENALRRFREMKNLGYDVKLEGRYRQNPVYWIDYNEQTDTPSLDMKVFVGAQSLPRACETIASSEPLP